MKRLPRCQIQKLGPIWRSGFVPQTSGYDQRRSSGSDSVFGTRLREHSHFKRTVDNEKELIRIRMHFPDRGYTGDAACANVVLVESNDIQESAVRYRGELRKNVLHLHCRRHAVNHSRNRIR